VTKTAGNNSLRNRPRHVLAICLLCVLAVILIAGLWPFHAPKNQVSWLAGEHGLRFGQRGIVISKSPFHAESREGRCSLEILLEPVADHGSGTILAFDSSPNPRFPFALRQFDDALAIQRAKVEPNGTLIRPWLQTRHVFDSGQPVLLTITGDEHQTTLYRDGIPIRRSTTFGLVDDDFTGRLILGSSTIRDAWSGSIFGLAVYSTELTPMQVARHAAQGFGQDPDTPPAALYEFDAGAGTIVPSRNDRAGELMIPPRYMVADRVYLEPIWKPFVSRWEGGMTWSYWSDVFTNIAGFVPFGFFCAAYLATFGSLRRARWSAIVLGFVVSFAIESIQYFLPTRDSSMTDLVTNTIGTALGAASVRPTVLKQLSTTLGRVSLSAGKIFSPRRTAS
jgi:glycopeptide antibiotics resistance protein